MWNHTQLSNAHQTSAIPGSWIRRTWWSLKRWMWGWGSNSWTRALLVVPTAALPVHLGSHSDATDHTSLITEQVHAVLHSATVHVVADSHLNAHVDTIELHIG